MWKFFPSHSDSLQECSTHEPQTSDLRIHLGRVNTVSTPFALMSSTADLELGAKLIAFTIFYYDYFITLPTEVTRIWLGKPLSRPSLWFLINRYIPFFGNIAIVVFSSCHAYGLARQLLLIANQIVVCLLLALRTYALYDCSRRIAYFMVCAAVAMTALSGWALLNQHDAMALEVQGCHEALSSSAGIHLAILWEAQAVFDLTIFVLTILKTLQTRRECMVENVHGKGLELTDVIFRDGALYFAAMVVCNTANILTFYLAEPVLKGFLSTPASCISVTLMSRLMLNLYDSASTHTDGIIVYELASVSHPALAGASVSSPPAKPHDVHSPEEGTNSLHAEISIIEHMVGMDDIRDIQHDAESSSSSVA